MKPKIFIGSSVEGLPYANAVFTELESVAEPTVWDQDVFRPMYSNLESLLRALNSFDFAVLVLTPDDIRTSRGKRSAVPRDNVIAEIGMFIGALGRDRVFFIKPQSQAIALPSNFLGIDPLEYTARKDLNYRASVRTACTEIIRYIAIKMPIRQHRQPTETFFWHTVAQRRADGVDVPSLIANARKRVLITGIALNYVSQHCSQEIQDALDRRMRVEIVIATLDDLSNKRYYRFTSLKDPDLPMLVLAYERYKNLVEKLSESQRKYFGVYATSSPMAHSIGLYDDDIYVSEFCLNTDAAVCPSYRIAPGDESYDLFMGEIRSLLSDAQPLFRSDESCALALEMK